MTTSLFAALVPLVLASPDPAGTEPVEDADAPTSAGQEEAEPSGPQWSGTFTVGITETQGNTETFSAAFFADVERKTKKDRYTSKSFWNYAEQSGNITERNVGTSLQYDYFIREDLWWLATSGVESDDLANLDLRYWAGVGVGRQFYDTEKFDLSGETALTYFKEEFEDDGNPLTDDEEDKIALKLGYDLAYVFSEKTRFKQSFEAFPAIDDPDDVFLRLDSRLETNLTERMLASLQYVLDWDNTPAPGAKRDDHRIVLSLGWSFGG